MLFFLKATAPFYTLISMRVPASPYLHQHLLLTTYIYFLILFILVSVRGYLLVFLTCNYLFYFLATPQDLWDLNFQTRDWTQVLVVKVLIPNHWTARESLKLHFSNKEGMVLSIFSWVYVLCLYTLYIVHNCITSLDNCVVKYFAHF